MHPHTLVRGSMQLAPRRSHRAGPVAALLDTVHRAVTRSSSLPRWLGHVFGAEGAALSCDRLDGAEAYRAQECHHLPAVRVAAMRSATRYMRAANGWHKYHLRTATHSEAENAAKMLALESASLPVAKPNSEASRRRPPEGGVSILAAHLCRVQAVASRRR